MGSDPEGGSRPEAPKGSWRASERVSLHGDYKVWLVSGANTGNAHIKLRRADGSQVTLNPRSSFAGRTASAENNVKVLR
ncbi:hypothetical protein OG339_40490 [Streptosporangium sp. NBC_01495]|uniref:hypothetical protein n=1 Tax=Streptosporangium sp. NBC_01495 TaxID=2903899 RepID=UPI002E347EDD|nr:hypothetical protein [Streptosporangium sp. NBC_01495]